jgi:hypothetical protein
MHCARLWLLASTSITLLFAIGCGGNSYIAGQKASCTNSTLDKGETDVDCGGIGCPACGVKMLCIVDKDCDDGLLCSTDPTDSAGAKRCSYIHCHDKKRNEGESDVDCGGECLPCTAGQFCKISADCDSGVCSEGTCSQASCSDNKQNQDESDIDCGSILTASACSSCADGKKCFSDDNCESKLCKSGFCSAATCSDSRKNGNEGGVDCGGTCPTACNQDSSCNKDADCKSNVCRSNVCLGALCGDGVLNGNETDVDCGGSCGVCSQNAACNLDADCVTSFCYAHLCQVATCSDGIKNQGESDIDCGDLRGYCSGCAPTRVCLHPSSCVSNNCVDWRCVESTCSDFIKNGLEGDTDCGGDCPAKCQDGQHCREMKDCESGVCTDTLCIAPTCGDGVKNARETDVDCGGSACTNKCDNGLGCSSNSDCKINSCAGGKCSDPSCNNSTMDGTETDVDCGGTGCGKCTAAKKCAKNDDCQSLNCVNLTCAVATCEDRIQNGRETFTDCGGDCAKKCDVGQTCGVGTDCVTSVCSGGVCKAATCDDQVKNGLETAVDCGGADCIGLAAPRLCAKGQGCIDDMDCKAKLICDAAKGACADWSCTDLRKNQDETDVDCGGTCPGCGTDKVCVVAGDCKDRICAAGRCAAPKCSDLTKNGNEGDVDCGGSCLKKCANEAFCNLGLDCESGVCSDTSPQTCLPPTCSDNTKNGDETDVDCGGKCATKCADGKICKVRTDCASVDPLTTCKAVGEYSVCTPPGCGDSIKGGNETDIDCGGNCVPCSVGKGCLKDGDCTPIASGKCIAGKCTAAACTDLVRNGAESDVDCGGSGASGYPVCGACSDGKMCNVSADCASKSCNGTCLVPTCSDGILNGSEVSTDCGTACASAGKLCADGLTCTVDADCSSGWCNASKKCQTRSCADGILNGTEGDIDCGKICNSAAKLCTVGKGCKIDTDCDSGACSECAGKCVNAPSQCYALGTGCTQCPQGQACTVDFDCTSLACDPTTLRCVAPDNCYGKVLAAGALSANCQRLVRCLFVNNVTLAAAKANPDSVCGTNKFLVGNAIYDEATSALTAVGGCP